LKKAATRPLLGRALALLRHNAYALQPRDKLFRITTRIGSSWRNETLPDNAMGSMCTKYLRSTKREASAIRFDRTTGFLIIDLNGFRFRTVLTVSAETTQPWATIEYSPARTEEAAMRLFGSLEPQRDACVPVEVQHIGFMDFLPRQRRLWETPSNELPRVHESIDMDGQVALVLADIRVQTDAKLRSPPRIMAREPTIADPPDW
jgi:hypothetical protein